MMLDVTIRHSTTDEIAIFGDIRLESLASDPNAFASNFRQWERLSDDEWLAHSDLRCN